MTVARTIRGLMLVGLVGLCGCSELQARRHARLGNDHYREGDYAGAVREYQEADQLYPGLPVVVLNLGLACRQQLIPGSRTAENERAVKCALSAFQRLQELKPDDPRGEQLYIQTLFDADRYDELKSIYEARLRAKPDNMAAIEGMIQVSSRSNDWEQELKWTAKRADLRPDDAEAQYATGVFIWSILYRKGGAGEKAKFDPRPPVNEDDPPKVPPQFYPGEIAGKQRIELANQGLKYLERAVKVRPNYREAIIYLNLLYRQKAFAFFDQPDRWLELLNEADTWRKKAQALTPQDSKKKNGASESKQGSDETNPAGAEH